MSRLTIYLAAHRSVGSPACRRPSGTRKCIDNGYDCRWPRHARLRDIQSRGGTRDHTRHNVWSGGTLPVIVTLVGWLIFAKGLVLMLVTPETLIPFLERMQQHYHYPFYIVPALIIGLYLTYAGFAARPKQS